MPTAFSSLSSESSENSVFSSSSSKVPAPARVSVDSVVNPSSSFAPSAKPAPVRVSAVKSSSSPDPHAPLVAHIQAIYDYIEDLPPQLQAAYIQHRKKYKSNPYAADDPKLLDDGDDYDPILSKLPRPIPYFEYDDHYAAHPPGQEIGSP